MPLYEYKCNRCASVFERIESFSAEPVHECPSCGAEARRQLGVPALQFKGSGWYVTDYGKGGSVPACERKATSDSKPAACNAGGCGSGTCAA